MSNAASGVFGLLIESLQRSNNLLDSGFRSSLLSIAAPSNVSDAAWVAFSTSIK
ncbi:hypothetical protein H6F78_17710 [Coleofasciculus sp. FACHB-64]|uniref:hypothetical protein n=1 Tax=Cyanophyceae TaxID=3028117 RepID=UPI0016823C4C|nr:MULTISPECIES: hypothetical protein [unclassified Coleofasciculus]MBD1840391.1 hypothetical protein [Coleofasciculus sp. FACHB-501]MBD2047406.1 hypothetical protein [Coleofasciculus sp. FACHB-64]